jgi:DMSO/TMAO reductase YedYZ molybdopterin-dependent catalytic subunit
MSKKSDNVSQVIASISFILLGLIIFLSLNQISDKPLSEGFIPPDQTIHDSAFDLQDFISMHPAEVNNRNFPITPIEELHITGSAPKIYSSHYHLTIDGLVNTPLILTYEELLAFPTVTNVALLTCRNFFCDNAEWTGVPVQTLLTNVSIKPGSNQVVFTAADGYQVTLPLEVMFRDDVFLAHTVNGQILPKEHGFPLRLVVTGEFGSKWIKWVERIEIK